MVSKAGDDLPEPDRPVITLSRSRGRSRSMFFRLWVRAPRMRMLSIAIGGGDLGSGGGGRGRERDRTEERNDPPPRGPLAAIDRPPHTPTTHSHGNRRAPRSNPGP